MPHPTEDLVALAGRANPILVEDENRRAARAGRAEHVGIHNVPGLVLAKLWDHSPAVNRRDPKDPRPARRHHMEVGTAHVAVWVRAPRARGPQDAVLAVAEVEVQRAKRHALGDRPSVNVTHVVLRAGVLHHAVGHYRVAVDRLSRWVEAALDRWDRWRSRGDRR